ncbi:MAG: hypothetical protein LBV69_11835 [Bacteroidales bacterium]|jgi:hypothetical protein|nr:hypothetical protein [Bacteroidales bacterium]
MRKKIFFFSFMLVSLFSFSQNYDKIKFRINYNFEVADRIDYLHNYPRDQPAFVTEDFLYGKVFLMIGGKLIELLPPNEMIFTIFVCDTIFNREEICLLIDTLYPRHKSINSIDSVKKKFVRDTIFIKDIMFSRKLNYGSVQLLEFSILTEKEFQKYCKKNDFYIRDVYKQYGIYYEYKELKIPLKQKIKIRLKKK